MADEGQKENWPQGPQECDPGAVVDVGMVFLPNEVPLIVRVRRYVNTGRLAVMLIDGYGDPWGMVSTWEVPTGTPIECFVVCSSFPWSFLPELEEAGICEPTKAAAERPILRFLPRVCRRLREGGLLPLDHVSKTRTLPPETIGPKDLHVHFTANTLGEKEIDDLTAIEDWYRQTEGTGKIGEVVFHGPDGAETRHPITGVRVVSHDEVEEVDTAEDWARALADPGTGEDPAERVEPVGSPPTRPAARRSPRITRPAPERPQVIEDLELTHVSMNPDGSLGIGGTARVPRETAPLPSVALVGPGALVTLEDEVRRLAEAAKGAEWVRFDLDSEGYRATVEGAVRLDVYWDGEELTTGTHAGWVWEVDLETVDLDGGQGFPLCSGVVEVPGPEGLETAKASAIEDVADALTLALWRVLGHPKT